MKAITECLEGFEKIWIMAGGSPINWMELAGASLIIAALLLLLSSYLKSKVEKVGYAVTRGSVTTYYQYKR